MNQENRPDQVIGPAQAALAYYQKNGYFTPAGVESMMLIRAQRDKGHYDEALSSANAFLALASRSGLPDLTRQAEELIGSVLEKMEHYPDALAHFMNAKNLADAPSSEQYEAVFAAEILWKLGRFAECEEMLRFEPATEAMGISAELERITSLLGQAKYRQSLQHAQQTLVKHPGMSASDQQELALAKALAESHLHQEKEALKDLEMSAPSGPGDPAENATRNMEIAEVNLGTGHGQTALEAATRAAERFKTAGQLDSELRSACLGTAAAKLVRAPAAQATFSVEVVDIVSKIQQTWTPQASQTYLSRPDLQLLMRQDIASGSK
jgi:tetratricopeptide (TPR) repeat protein